MILSSITNGQWFCQLAYFQPSIKTHKLWVQRAFKEVIPSRDCEGGEFWESMEAWHSQLPQLHYTSPPFGYLWVLWFNILGTVSKRLSWVLWVALISNWTWEFGHGTSEFIASWSQLWVTAGFVINTWKYGQSSGTEPSPVASRLLLWI